MKNDTKKRKTLNSLRYADSRNSSRSELVTIRNEDHKVETVKKPIPPKSKKIIKIYIR